MASLTGDEMRDNCVDEFFYLRPYTPPYKCGVFHIWHSQVLQFFISPYNGRQKNRKMNLTKNDKKTQIREHT